MIQRRYTSSARRHNFIVSSTTGWRCLIKARPLQELLWKAPEICTGREKMWHGVVLPERPMRKSHQQNAMRISCVLFGLLILHAFFQLNARVLHSDGTKTLRDNRLFSRLYAEGMLNERRAYTAYLETKFWLPKPLQAMHRYPIGKNTI